MDLNEVTPLVLTFNEAANVERCLNGLKWAKTVVLLDSFSSDDTVAIAKKYPNVKIFQRQFGRFADQWNFGLKKTGIETEWVLALDADYILTDVFIEEVRTVSSSADICGYRSRFIYCICGKRLRGSIYPPVTVLFRRKNARYFQDGHTHRIRVAGEVSMLERAKVLHDDRKPILRWLNDQTRHQALEAKKLIHTPDARLSAADRIRKNTFFSPFVVFWYCYIMKGLVWDGAFGLYYSLQRAYAEILLLLLLMGSRLGLVALEKIQHTK